MAATLRDARRVAADLGCAPLLREIDALVTRTGTRLDAPETVSAEPADGVRFGLTPRERAVLAELATGAKNRTIGRTLFISERTVGVHVSNILAKLGVTNRVEAARIAHQRGLDTAPRPDSSRPQPEKRP